MSKLDKMGIMGIRSFGPEDTDQQRIQFYTPLTLILGPNGAGKTTIIECLKYITTGSLPPNSMGRDFVHNPKVAQRPQVTGQVRLQLRDITGHLVQARRSMEATQKQPNRIEARTLDTVITRFDKEGRKSSIPCKSADFNREMVTALGVSKPVLINVIFCHQEDSCWPLSEGKSLKDKFDAIFDTTRYTKVLEALCKQKAVQEIKLKSYREVIESLKQQKDKATQMEKELAEQEAKFEASKDNIQKLTQQLEPVTEHLTRYEEARKVQTEIEKLESRKGQVETNIRTLQNKIKHEFQGTTEELEKQLSEFDGKVQEHQDSLTQFEQRSKELRDKQEMLSKEVSTLLEHVGKLKQEAETHENNISERDAEVCRLAADYGFEGFKRGAITDEKYGSFLNNIRQKRKTMKEELRKVKGDFKERERALQQKIDAARDKKTQLKQTQRLKEEEMEKNKREISQIEQELGRMEASPRRLDDLTQELKNAEDKLIVAEMTVSLEDLKRDITQLEEERRQLDTKMSKLK